MQEDKLESDEEFVRVKLLLGFSSSNDSVMMISDTSSSSSLLSVRDVWVTGLMLGTLFSEELLLRLFCDDCDCDEDEDEDEDADEVWVEYSPFLLASNKDVAFGAVSVAVSVTVTIGVKLALTAISGSIPTTTTWSTIPGSFLLRNFLHSAAISLQFDSNSILLGLQ